jgi:hypothetical protein
MLSMSTMTMQASARGTTRYTMGSALHMRSASTCSVTVIEPISAAMPLPTRVAIMSPVMVGANSRIIICKNAAPSIEKSGMICWIWSAT